MLAKMYVECYSRCKRTKITKATVSPLQKWKITTNIEIDMCMCSTYNKKLQNSQIKTHENEGNWVDWGGWDTGKDGGESVRNRANATKMENARAKQSKTWKISISGYGMKKRFLLVRNMAQTYESHRLQKYVWDYLSLVTLSLVFYLFMLFMLSLFVLVLVFLVAAWAPITNHCAILFQLYHLKNRPIFPFLLRCCSVLFFSISFIVFFILFFFCLLWSVIMGPSTWIVPIRCVLNIFD